MAGRIGLCLFVLLLAAIGRPASPAAGQGVVVSGVVWYDDNRNGVFDAAEDPAAQVTIDVMTGRYRPHGGQPMPVATTIADAAGRFRVAFEPAAGEPAFLRVVAFRPGYPHPRVRGEDYPNYRSADTPIPLGGAGPVAVGVPLRPLGGVIERLAAGEPLDFPIPDGHFFTQTNGYAGGSALGFAVTNAAGIPFWETWQRLGLENVGYPLSGRFTWAGLVHQVFQKAVFQWRPDSGTVAFVNLFDELHRLNLDGALRERDLVPFPVDPEIDAGKSWDEIVRDRLALLDADPVLKARYFAAPDPLLLHGLPSSRVEDHGIVAVVRTQRTVLQHWKVDVPFARAGEVTIANGGEIAKEHAVFVGSDPPYPDLFVPVSGFYSSSHRH